MDSNLTGMWVNFFTSAGIPPDTSATYALTFSENRIQSDMLLDLNKEYLRDMGITRMGDVIAILRHAKQVHENTARDRVLNTASTATKVPVAAVTGRSTVTQPSSPASRILEHYTRNPQVSQVPETSPTSALKRKLIDMKQSANLNRPDPDDGIKKARLIRFAAAAKSKTGASKPVVYETKAVPSKVNVFSRLGNSEEAVPESRKPQAATTQAKVPVRPIFSRLGSKSEEAAVMPIDRDALKYEGILKSCTVVKKVTVTSNNVRKITTGTMRADESPVSVKEKLALPKAKSVKFSNHVEYKEIEGNTKPSQTTKPKVSLIFNKPERRLSMPEGVDGVKARLGTKNVNNLTITKNIFNRLGV